MVDEEKDLFEQCECVSVKYAKKILEVSGVDQDDFKKTFSNFVPVEHENVNNAKISAINYVKNFSEIESTRCNSIAFLGVVDKNVKKGVGCGKTHLAMAITNNLMAKGIAVRYFRYREEIVKIKQSVNDAENYQRAMNTWKKCRVLFIDDLFKASATEADIKAIYEIIDFRYVNRLPIIITTELNIIALDMIDQAIASRIYEMSKEYMNVLGGDNANFRYK